MRRRVKPLSTLSQRVLQRAVAPHLVEAAEDPQAEAAQAVGAAVDRRAPGAEEGRAAGQVVRRPDDDG